METDQEHEIKLYLKQSLPTTAQSTIQRVCHPFQLSIRRYLIIPLDLAKLPIGEKFNSAASVMAKQTIDV